MHLSIHLSIYLNVYLYREERKHFIREKYIDKSFIEQYCSNPRELHAELEQVLLLSLLLFFQNISNH